MMTLPPTQLRGWFVFLLGTNLTSLSPPSEVFESPLGGSLADCLKDLDTIKEFIFENLTSLRPRPEEVIFLICTIIRKHSNLFRRKSHGSHLLYSGTGFNRSPAHGTA